MENQDRRRGPRDRQIAYKRIESEQIQRMWDILVRQAKLQLLRPVMTEETYDYERSEVNGLIENLYETEKRLNQGIIFDSHVHDEKSEEELTLSEELKRSPFNRRLKTLRIQADLTQNELGTNASLEGSYISKLEKGGEPPPSREAALRLLDGLGITGPIERFKFLLSAGRGAITDLQGFEIEHIKTGHRLSNDGIWRDANGEPVGPKYLIDNKR